MKLRVYKILKNTKVEGPENRYCIWVQGCSIHCSGCQAVHTWPHNGGKLYDTNDIITDILAQKNIEGVTFLGGEPFEQAEALGEIASKVKEAGLGVLCFTGNYLENLKTDKKNEKLLSCIDLLIDSPFEIDKLDYSRPWCGSKNQRYHFLTDRYNKKIFTKYKNKVEFNIAKDGTVFINGMGNFDEIMTKTHLKKVSLKERS